MQYYYLGIRRFEKGYAYSDYENDSVIDFNLIEKCPLCGANISGGKHLRPYNVVLSSKKLGDFIFGLFEFFIVSANFKEKYEKSGLTGIKEFRKIDRLRFRKDIIDAEYYEVVPERVNVRPEPIEVDEEDSRRGKCELCNPRGKIDYGIRGLKMNLNGLDKTPEVFLTYTRCSSIFCNQNFVDFCFEQKFTNFDTHIESFDEFISGCFSAERVAAAWKE